MRMLRILLTLAALLALALPATALASGDEVIRDCAQDGDIDGDYSQKELKEAEENLPSDLDEYTDCREAIRGEMGGGPGNGSGGGGSGGDRVASDPSLVTDSGAVATTQEDIEALDELTGSGSGSGDGDAPPVDIGGTAVTPGEGAGAKLLGAANAANGIPTSLLSALIVLVLAAAASAFLLLRRRMPPALATRLGALRERLPSLRPDRPIFANRKRVPLPRFLRR